MENILKDKNLDPQVSEFLNSMLRVYLTLELAEKYKVTGNKIREITNLIFDLAKVNITFSNIPKEVMRIFSFDEGKAVLFSRDLLGTHFLFLESYFPGMMEAFESFGGRPEEYIDTISRISKELAEERNYFKDQLIPGEEFVFEQKEVIDDIFTENENRPLTEEEYASLFNSGVINFLFKLTDPYIVDEFNEEVVNFINEYAKSQNNFFKNLLENQEKVSKEQLIIEDKIVEPTVANWLKDFIKEKGSDFFDELKLVEYLTTSPNPKNISSDEKDILRRLLKLYRNLNFLQLAHEGVPMEYWQILPFEDNEIQEKTLSEKKNLSIRLELESSLRSFQRGSLEYEQPVKS